MKSTPLTREGRRGRRRYLVVGLLLFAALVVLANQHFITSVEQLGPVLMINIIAFGWLLLTLYLAHAHRDHETTARQQRTIEKLRVTVVMPLFSEDPYMFRRCLDSLTQQSRPVDRIHIVDDGSPDGDCQRVFYDWLPTAPPGVDAEYTWQDNAGKREAQARAFCADPHADVFMTLDSDTVLDPDAVANGLKPFAHAEVKSVAGMLLGLNNRESLLARLVDLGFVLSYVNGRAAWSQVRSIVVNSGALAFYRAEVVRQNLDAYLTQTVMGNPAASGDDRMLTNYALLEGATVFQQSVVGYTEHPTKLRVLTKQRVRWWRSFFWGGVWLLRRFPPNRLAWWLVCFQFVNMALYTVLLPVALVVLPIMRGGFVWGVLAYIAILSYVRGARYLSVKRPDEPYRSQLLTYAIAPLSSLLHMYLITVLQYVGLVTFHKTGWGTRGGAAEPEPVDAGLDALFQLSTPITKDSSHAA